MEQGPDPSLGYHACHARMLLFLNYGIAALVFLSWGIFAAAICNGYVCVHDCTLARGHRSCCGLRSTY